MVRIGSSDVARMQARIDYLKSRKDELKDENLVLLGRIRAAYELVAWTQKSFEMVAEAQEDQAEIVAEGSRELSKWTDEVEAEVDDDAFDSDDEDARQDDNTA